MRVPFLNPIQGMGHVEPKEVLCAVGYKGTQGR